MIRHFFITIFFCAISSSFRICPLRLELKSSVRRLSFLKNAPDAEECRHDGKGRDNTDDDCGKVDMSSELAPQPYSLENAGKILIKF
jgi:hypothetical protein